jgi:uncharacterized protein (TIGR00296 family)
MNSYSLSDGERLVKAARQAIELRIISPHFRREMVERLLEGFDEERGVFVTIEHYPTRELRGCIGFPRAADPLKKSLVDAAIAAATEDPRFVPVSHQEFEHMLIEVSVLTDPEPIVARDEEQIKKAIKIGRDGLIIESGYNGGLLLPIVAIEQGWGKKEFLENLCLKAGLPPYYWKNPKIKLQKFSCQIFKEISPSGKVQEIVLD